jgi:hypothetical protein
MCWLPASMSLVFLERGGEKERQREGLRERGERGRESEREREGGREGEIEKLPAQAAALALAIQHLVHGVGCAAET